MIDNIQDIEEITEKYDGAMVSSYFLEGRIAWASRKCLQSNVVNVANQMWKERYAYFENKIDSDLTLVCELIHPATRILVDYNFQDLVLLAVLNKKTGEQFSRAQMEALSHDLGMRIASKIDMPLDKMFDDLNYFTHQQEGYVVKMADGGIIKLSNQFYNYFYDITSSPTQSTITRIWMEWVSCNQLIPYLPQDYKPIVRGIFNELDEIFFYNCVSREECVRLYLQDKKNIKMKLKDIMPYDL